MPWLALAVFDFVVTFFCVWCSQRLGCQIKLPPPRHWTHKAVGRCFVAICGFSFSGGIVNGRAAKPFSRQATRKKVWQKHCGSRKVIEEQPEAGEAGEAGERRRDKVRTGPQPILFTFAIYRILRIHSNAPLRLGLFYTHLAKLGQMSHPVLIRLPSCASLSHPFTIPYSVQGERRPLA